MTEKRLKYRKELPLLSNEEKKRLMFDVAKKKISDTVKYKVFKTLKEMS